MEGTRYTCTSNGWSNAVTFTDFFENHFLKHVTTRPCLLLYDGHSTHITTQVIERARDADVLMFVLPPHTSHVSQPLDVAIFSPMKVSITNEFHKFVHNNPGELVTRYDLSSIVGKSYAKALSVKNLQSGFRKTGILPFAPETLISSLSVPEHVSPPPKRMNLSRKERQDSRNIQSMLDVHATVYADARKQCEESSSTNKRSTPLPACGGLATEGPIYDALTARPPPTKEVRAHLEPEDDIEPAAAEVNQSESVVTPEESCSRPAVNETQKSDSDSELVNDGNCLMCDSDAPPGLTKSKEAFYTWAECVSCKGWCHLKYCVPETYVGPDDDFLCPFCK